MNARIALTLVAVAFAALAACASSGSGAGSAPPVPTDDALAVVRPGMSDLEVRRILGDPDSSVSYQTGKRWIPFYGGTDTRRTDWMYRGLGRVVFSRNQYSGALKVIRIERDPRERAGL